MAFMPIMLAPATVSAGTDTRPNHWRREREVFSFIVKILSIEH